MALRDPKGGRRDNSFQGKGFGGEGGIRVCPDSSHKGGSYDYSRPRLYDVQKSIVARKRWTVSS